MNDEEVAARIFGLKEGEGDARWWLAAVWPPSRPRAKIRTDATRSSRCSSPRAEAPLHVHHREDEAFWVLEGELTFQIGEETIKASPGSFLFGPKDVPHRYTVDSGPARMLFYPLAPGLRGVHLRHQRAGQGAHPAAPAGRPA